MHGTQIKRHVKGVVQSIFTIGKGMTTSILSTFQLSVNCRAKLFILSEEAALEKTNVEIELALLR